MSETRLADLLQTWQQLRDEGKTPSPEEICADCPELVEDLRQRVATLQTAADPPTARPFDPNEDTLPLDGPNRPAVTPEHNVTSATRFGSLEFHARGGLGEIYKAADEELGRHVALKFINWEQLEKAERVGQFKVEAQITSRLDHPGVVPVYGIGESWDGRPFYVMRFIEGQSFEDEIADYHARKHTWDSHKQHLELQRLLRHFVSVCHTVAYAHNRGVVHRDIKPQNIMLGKYGETLIVDWGLAAPYDRDERARSSGEKTLRLSDGNDGGSTGSGSGTPAYMSPEQMVGGLDPVGPASDIYCLGGTLYRLLSGRIPFHGARRRRHIDKPAEMDKHVPKPLKAICKKAMAIISKERYATALEMAEDVERWLADEPVEVYHEPWGEKAVRFARRHRNWTISIAAAVILSCVIAAIAAVMLAVTADSKHRAMLDAEEARGIAEDSTERGLRVAANFAARNVASEIDRRWRILQQEAATEDLRTWMSTINEKENDSEDWKEAQKRLLKWIGDRRAFYAPSVESASWFLNDQRGWQIARDPDAESVGQNYRFRDYFHGRGSDLSKDGELDGVHPIREPHRSNVYISTNTKKPMVAFSVPILADPEDRTSEVLGILAMAAQLSGFGSHALPEGQVAVLVDLNSESQTVIDGVRGGRRGLIIDHPHLATLRANKNNDAAALRHYLSEAQVDELGQLQRGRFEFEKFRREFPEKTIPEHLASPGLYVTDYHDPLGGEYEGKWLAAFEPVFVTHESIEKENGVHNTGWIVIVQQRYGP